MKIEDELKSSFRNEYHKLIVNLQLTHIRVSERFHHFLKEYDITPTQYNVLRILRGQQKNPVSIGLIKERMIDRNSDASRIIERLSKKKLVKRTENKIDRRQKDIIITNAGLDLLGAIDKVEQEVDQMLSHITPEEAKNLNQLLDKLRSKNE